LLLISIEVTFLLGDRDMNNTLENDIKELITKTKGLLSEDVSIHNYNAYVYDTEIRLKKMAFSDKKYKNQETFDLFNLCHELVDASSFENKHETPFVIALDILDNNLGEMYSSDGWKEIVKLRGPIEEITIYACNQCSYSFPVISFSGFSDDIFAYCDTCGDILFMNKYLLRDKIEKAGINFREYENLLPGCTNDGGKYVFSFSFQVPFGTTESTCPKCDSKSFLIKNVSRYQYFQEHNYTLLEL
jgi:predicted nucleic acid-binding Zn ribbon protein